MVEKLCTGAIGRFSRIILGFVLSRLIVLPFILEVPGLKGFLENPEFQIWLSAVMAASICSLMKKARDSDKVPKWIPL